MLYILTPRYNYGHLDFCGRIWYALNMHIHTYTTQKGKSAWAHPSWLRKYTPWKRSPICCDSRQGQCAKWSLNERSPLLGCGMNGACERATLRNIWSELKISPKKTQHKKFTLGILDRHHQRERLQHSVCCGLLRRQSFDIISTEGYTLDGHNISTSHRLTMLSISLTDGNHSCQVGLRFLSVF